MPVPAPKPWRRPPPDPLPVDLDDEASALDLIDRIRGLRLNGAETFEVWLQQRTDAEYAASLLIAHAGLTDETRAELEREATLLRRQANPPSSGARVWTRSDERISSASEVDDPRLAEARAYDMIDRMRSLRLNGATAGVDLYTERAYLLSQSQLLLTTATLRPATRRALATEVDLLDQWSDRVTSSADSLAHLTSRPTVPGREAAAEPAEAVEEAPVEPTPVIATKRPGFWRRLFGRRSGSVSGGAP